MGCEQLRANGTCEADPDGRRCINVPKAICREKFKYKKIGQITLG